ncbi:hypothetical protein MJO28_012725 [Puccinia striiformis f. sp. tritici]|uniref:Uncharacterized protein n=3 Tax=Puccinia striiformis TaxID=27350 RepID=A0A2S4UTX3_9BASI|nr:hypothetical protein Pst134EB_023270 [Puccinia striiformis f. sp. tritici]KAI7942698.1 hypothetical protein MJO28_012725 [Puccinia striiformis f. sp. tritici]KAI7945320.1 hypothetical protein MJO29_011708 [Puccinia striiformis f. sp. tritici]POW00738.1 hypothetical protein PSTT_12929 [Puccinia striiformis]POW04971.1 hypothetical protein PSHT_11001 [Puccinia striiformis]
MQITRLTIIASIFSNLSGLKAAGSKTVTSWKTPQQNPYLLPWVTDEVFHGTWRNSVLYSPNNQDFQIQHLDVSPARRLSVSRDSGIEGWMRLKNTGTQSLQYMVQDTSTGQWLVDKALAPEGIDIVAVRTASVYLKAI